MIHRLPALRDPQRYVGLYIFDFGEHVSVGYTAEEIEHLLSEPRYADGQVYRIQRARLDGTVELRGVSPETWSRTTGMVFWFADEAEARSGLAVLLESPAALRPPGRVEAILCYRAGRELPCALVLRYLQELGDAVSSWLLRIDYTAGLAAEGGRNAVDQASIGAQELAREELTPPEELAPRSKEEVLASTHYAVQR